MRSVVEVLSGIAEGKSIVVDSHSKQLVGHASRIIPLHQIMSGNHLVRTVSMCLSSIHHSMVVMMFTWIGIGVDVLLCLFVCFDFGWLMLHCGSLLML